MVLKLGVKVPSNTKVKLRGLFLLDVESAVKPLWIGNLHSWFLLLVRQKNRDKKVLVASCIAGGSCYEGTGRNRSKLAQKSSSRPASRAECLSVISTGFVAACCSVVSTAVPQRKLNVLTDSDHSQCTSRTFPPSYSHQWHVSVAHSVNHW